MYVYSPLLNQVANKLVVSLLVTAVGGALVWPFKAIKSAVKAATDRLTAVEHELVTQRVNCLTTIQNNTEKTNDILERVATTLDNTHITQIEMSGFLKGMKNKR
jgi:hypothetical protein